MPGMINRLNMRRTKLMSFDKRTQMPVRAKMESKAFWVVDAADCVDVLSSLKPEANILSLDTTYAMIKGPKGGGIQRVYLLCIPSQ